MNGHTSWNTLILLLLNVIGIYYWNIYIQKNKVNTNTATRTNCLELVLFVSDCYSFVFSICFNTRFRTQNRYDPASKSNETMFCLKQQFTYTINSNLSSSYFDILCRFVETADYLDRISLTLFRLCNCIFLFYSYFSKISKNKLNEKLDDDGLPRIRSGISLDNVNGVVEHNINKEKLSCEALKYSNQVNKFNALQWLTADMNKTIG